MAHYPFVNFNSSAGCNEYTQVAANSCIFAAKAYMADNSYQIGSLTYGWRVDELKLGITIPTGSSTLPFDFGNCMIKLPVDLVAGDKIKICGTSSSTEKGGNLNGIGFGVSLSWVNCGITSIGDSSWPLNFLTKNTSYVFVGNHICWSIEFIVDRSLKKCETGLVLGFGSDTLDKPIGVTWTMDIEKPCDPLCEYEYTKIAAGSDRFIAANSYKVDNLLYGFTEGCGWESSDGTTSFNFPSNDRWPLNLANNAIKLPIDLVTGDKITVCGIAHSLQENLIEPGTAFYVSFYNILCSTYNAEQTGFPIGTDHLSIQFSFNANGFVCWSFDVEIKAPLTACDTSFLLGFATQDYNKICAVSWTIDITRNCGKCSTEYTPIASTSGSFTSRGFSDSSYFIGSTANGWSSCILNVAEQINSQIASAPLNVNFTHSSIKLPYDLVQGDKIKICGISYGSKSDLSGANFAAALTGFNCANFNEGSNTWTIPEGWAFTQGSFVNNKICWTLDYIIPSSGLKACETNLLLGLNSSADGSEVQYTWTMNIEKVCGTAMETGCCFTHANTLFVDPNGNDATALEGKQTKPWKTIAKAIEYLFDNKRSGYTIEVFSGTYNAEDFWIISGDKNNNTTIRLHGNVDISPMSSLSTSKFPSWINISGAVIKIIGDDHYSLKNKTGAMLGFRDLTDTSVSMAKISGESYVSFQNVYLYDNSTKNGWTISYTNDMSDGQLEFLNCKVSSTAYTGNIFFGSVDFPKTMGNPPRLIIRDSVFYSYPDTFGASSSNITYYFGIRGPIYFFIENSKFRMAGQSSQGDPAHIITTNQGYPVIGTFNSAVFFFNYVGEKSAQYVWYDNNTGNFFEVINPVVTNEHGYGPGFFTKNTGITLADGIDTLTDPLLYDR